MDIDEQPAVYCSADRHAMRRHDSARGSSARLVFALVVASLLLGAAVNWGWRQQQRHSRARAMVDIVQMDLTLLQARQADVTMVLSDPQTQLLALRGESGSASAAESGPAGSGVAVAWNRRMQRGVLVAGQLAPAPAGRVYRLWVAGGQESDAVAVTSFEVSPGGTARPFQLGGASAAQRFWITLEPSDAGDAPAGPVLFSASFEPSGD